MIEEVDRALQDWVKSILGSVTVSLSAPTESPSGAGVSLYLLELVHSPSPRQARQTPLQFSLRYLVTVWSSEEEKVHSMLEELVFAAMQHSDYEVTLDPPGPELWNAFGVVPRPAFMLKVKLRRELPEADMPLVLEPLVLEHAPLGALDGQLLGPGEIPIAGARVSLPGLSGRSTRTDADGKFRFSGLPNQARVGEARVETKGRRFSIKSTEQVGSGKPMIIRLEKMEV